MSICLCVCLSVCLHISKKTGPNFTKFSVHVDCGRGSVLLWRMPAALRCSMYFTQRALWCLMRIHKRRQHNSLNYTVSIPTKFCSTINIGNYTSIVSCAPGAKSASYDCLFIEIQSRRSGFVVWP